MSALPELPEAWGWSELGTPRFLEKQMREYGALCRKQALEEAARACETQIDPTQPNTTSGYAYWHAKQIKEIK